MSIPDLRLDNPLDTSQLPSLPWVTKLPARGRPQPFGHAFTWVNAKSTLVTITLLQLLLTFFVGSAREATWELSGWMAIIFAAVIFARPPRSRA